MHNVVGTGASSIELTASLSRARKFMASTFAANRMLCAVNRQSCIFLSIAHHQSDVGRRMRATPAQHLQGDLCCTMRYKSTTRHLQHVVRQNFRIDIPGSRMEVPARYVTKRHLVTTKFRNFEITSRFEISWFGFGLVVSDERALRRFTIYETGNNFPSRPIGCIRYVDDILSYRSMEGSQKIYAARNERARSRPRKPHTHTHPCDSHHIIMALFPECKVQQKRIRPASRVCLCMCYMSYTTFST